MVRSTVEGTHRNFFVFVTLKVQLSLKSGLPWNITTPVKTTATVASQSLKEQGFLGTS